MIRFLIFDIIMAVFGFPFTLVLLAIQVLFLYLGYQGASHGNLCYLLSYQVWGILCLILYVIEAVSSFLLLVVEFFGIGYFVYIILTGSDVESGGGVFWAGVVFVWLLVLAITILLFGLSTALSYYTVMLSLLLNLSHKTTHHSLHYSSKSKTV